MSKERALPWSNVSASDSREGDEVLAVIGRCLNGDGHAFRTLYNLYAAQTYRLVVGMLRDVEDSEEVVQDAFEYAFRRLEHYDPRKAAFRTWLFQIAVSRTRNKRRRRILPSFSINATPDFDIKDTNAQVPDRVVELDERQKVIWEALGTLSPKLRETAVLRYYDGFTYREIGTILGIPTKTAESRMRLAHKALKQILTNLED